MKISIFVIFWIFWILMMQSIIRPEPAGNVKFGRKWVLWTPKILPHTLYAIICLIEKVLQLSEKNHIFEFMMKILNIKDFHHKFKNMIFFRKL